MEAKASSGLDWRDGAAYAPLLLADRSLIAWEWLRRDPRYRAAAAHRLPTSNGRVADPAAAAFGLIGFEAPDLGVPDARPMWRADVHQLVLAVERGARGRPEDCFELGRWGGLGTLLTDARSEHLLLCDGFRTIRLDAPPATFNGRSACLRYRIEGLVGAEPAVLTLRHFLAFCRSGGFALALHPRERRARRWVLILRAFDALAAGAGQREIAEVLLSRTVQGPAWRSRDPSIRSQAQRLARSARSLAADGFRTLLSDHVPSRR